MTSIVHMALVCTNVVSYNPSDVPKSTKYYLNETQVVKQRIALINFSAIILALYLYNRHNLYCEPGVYSIFSFLEYIVIVANIVYHLQAYYDLSEYSIMVAKNDSLDEGTQSVNPGLSRKKHKKAS